jgi:hypothetical protein
MTTPENWRKEAAKAAIEHARLYGCTCDVVVGVLGSRRAPELRILHDEWCAVFENPVLQFVIVRDEEGL